MVQHLSRVPPKQHMQSLIPAPLELHPGVNRETGQSHLDKLESAIKPRALKQSKNEVTL